MLTEKPKILTLAIALVTFAGCSSSGPDRNEKVNAVITNAVQQEAKRIAANVAANMQNAPKKSTPVPATTRRLRTANVAAAAEPQE